MVCIMNAVNMCEKKKRKTIKVLHCAPRYLDVLYIAVVDQCSYFQLLWYNNRFQHVITSIVSCVNVATKRLVATNGSLLQILHTPYQM